MAKITTDMNKQTGAVRRKVRIGLFRTPSFGMLFPAITSFCGLAVGVISTNIATQDSAFPVASAIIGAILGGSVGKSFVFADYIENIELPNNSKAYPTLGQRIKMAFSLPITLHQAEYSKNPKYLDATSSDVERLIEEDDREYEIGAESETKIKVLPFHITIEQEWNKTQIGLWDDVLRSALKTDSYTSEGYEGPVRAKQILHTPRKLQMSAYKELT